MNSIHCKYVGVHVFHLHSNFLFADELVEYDPWGRAGVGVGPRCHRPGDNQIKGYKPLNFHPSQSERNTEPVIQLADYVSMNLELETCGLFRQNLFINNHLVPQFITRMDL